MRSFHVRSYAIFDNRGTPVFLPAYNILTDAMHDVAAYALTQPEMRPLFPLTIEALDGSDIYTVVCTVTLPEGN